MHTLIFAIDTNRLGIARLPKALQEAGFNVGTLCSPESVLTKTRYIDRRYALTSLKSGDYLLRSLIKAVRDWRPEILIPGDEMAVCFLHWVVQRAARQPDDIPQEVLKIVCNSLGSPEYFGATMFKHITQHLASELGIRTPVQQTIASTEAALDFAHLQGYPVVLKSDFSWSGAGITVCRDERQLIGALPALLPQTHPLKSVVRRWLRRDWYPTGLALSAQQFIHGRPAMYCLVAVAGEVLGGFAAIPEQTMSSTGQSSVVRLVNHREMATAAEKLTRQFGYTGFAGFDFMLGENEQAYFLECNPRPIPICHLGGLIGIDLCIALFEKMSGNPCTLLPPLEQDTLVAFFPQEWHRDPTSQHLMRTYHDVPWDDPELLKACIEWRS